MSEVYKSLWFGSDLHFERYADNYSQIFKREEIPESGVFDFAALPGDIAHSAHVPGIVEAVRDKMDCPVIYTPGNHEFYDGFRNNISMQEQVDRMRDGVSKIPDAYFLYNEGMDIPGTNYSIFAGPMFTDFGWYPDQDEVPRIESMINDYRLSLVGKSKVPLAAANHKVMNKAFISSMELWLENIVSRGRIPIIMSHFGPSRRSSHGHFNGTDLIASYFCTDYLDKNFHKFPVGTEWIHGHTHWNVDYQHGNVHVVTNQYGYRGETSCTETYNPLKYLRLK